MCLWFRPLEWLVGRALSVCLCCTTVVGGKLWEEASAQKTWAFPGADDMNRHERAAHKMTRAQLFRRSRRKVVKQRKARIRIVMTFRVTVHVLGKHEAQ